MNFKTDIARSTEQGPHSKGIRTAFSKFIVSGWIALASIVTINAAIFAAPVSLIPAPTAVNWLKGTVELNADTKIYFASATAQTEAETLAELLRPSTGFAFPVAAAPSKHDNLKGAVVLKIKPELKFSVGVEGYVLSVAPEGTITIEAAEPAGLFYGSQTLRQLLPAGIYADKHPRTICVKVRGGEGFALTQSQPLVCQVPCCHIVDSPRFAWRGYMLDFSRHWLDIEYTKHLLDGMAMHKLNVLHMHLADDDGWRIEIKKYPKLTEVGAWRGTQCEIPNTRPGETFERYGGFFTQDQIREIVAYAARWHIHVMPEIDLPGHSQALCISYPETRPMRMLDGKLVPSASTHVISPAKESNYAMIDDIVEELTTVFPYDYIHIGGDEVNYKPWDACPEVKALLAKEKLANSRMAQVYFTKRLEGILAKHHKKMIGWNEILNDKLERSTAIMSWTEVGPGYQAARLGFPVVMAPGQHNYFDMQYPDANDEPAALKWAGTIDSQKCYAFDPLGQKGITAEQGRRIMGVHACLWSELVVPFKAKNGWLDLKTAGETADYKTYPRLCALAEMGWTPQAGRNYADFAGRLGAHYERLQVAGIMFRVPMVDASESAGKIEIHSPVPKAEILYTLDGSDPLDAVAPKSWDGKPIKGDVKQFRARTIIENRSSPLRVGATTK